MKKVLVFLCALLVIQSNEVQGCERVWDTMCWAGGKVRNTFGALCNQRTRRHKTQKDQRTLVEAVAEKSSTGAHSGAAVFGVPDPGPEPEPTKENAVGVTGNVLGAAALSAYGGWAFIDGAGGPTLATLGALLIFSGELTHSSMGDALSFLPRCGIAIWRDWRNWGKDILQSAVPLVTTAAVGSMMYTTAVSFFASYGPDVSPVTNEIADCLKDHGFLQLTTGLVTLVFFTKTVRELTERARVRFDPNRSELDKILEALEEEAKKDKGFESDKGDLTRKNVKDFLARASEAKDPRLDSNFWKNMGWWAMKEAVPVSVAVGSTYALWNLHTIGLVSLLDLECGTAANTLLTDPAKYRDAIKHATEAAYWIALAGGAHYFGNLFKSRMQMFGRQWYDAFRNSAFGAPAFGAAVGIPSALALNQYLLAVAGLKNEVFSLSLVFGKGTEVLDAAVSYGLSPAARPTLQTNLDLLLEATMNNHASAWSNSLPIQMTFVAGMAALISTHIAEGLKSATGSLDTPQQQLLRALKKQRRDLPWMASRDARAMLEALVGRESASTWTESPLQTARRARVESAKAKTGTGVTVPTVVEGKDGPV